MAKASEPVAAQERRETATRTGAFRLGDIVAALHKEVANAAAAANADDTPGLMIANVDFDISYVVAEASSEGVWVALHGAPVKAAKPAEINRMRLSVVDVDVAALPDLAARRRTPG